MQPLNRNDPRPMYQRIANSIRASILAGDLAPGEKLPSMQQLSEQFHAARMTVAQAITTLKQEGFVYAVAGSGVYVSNSANASPSTDAPTSGGLVDITRYIYELGTLKKGPRAGWSIPGVPIPETIGSHIFRTAVIGLILATMEAADVGRTVTLCILHDNHESRIGDIASVARPYVRTAEPQLVVQHQTELMPAALRAAIREAVQQFEAQETPEAVIARDADKLEAIVQGREYEREGGFNTTEWQASAIASLKTDSGKQLAQSIVETDPQDWWQAFVRSYNELTAISRRDAGGQSSS